MKLRQIVSLRKMIKSVSNQFFVQIVQKNLQFGSKFNYAPVFSLGLKCQRTFWILLVLFSKKNQYFFAHGGFRFGLVAGSEGPSEARGPAAVGAPTNDIIFKHTAFF